MGLIVLDYSGRRHGAIKLSLIIRIDQVQPMIDFLAAWLGLPTLHISLFNFLIALVLAFRAGLEVGRKQVSKQCEGTLALCLPSANIEPEPQVS